MKKWNLEAQMKVDLNQTGLDLEADRKRYSEVYLNQTQLDVENSKLKNTDSNLNQTWLDAESSKIKDIGLNFNEPGLGETEKNRTTRFDPAAALIPLVTSLAPGISTFMNK